MLAISDNADACRIFDHSGRNSMDAFAMIICAVAAYSFGEKFLPAHDPNFGSRNKYRDPMGTSSFPGSL